MHPKGERGGCPIWRYDCYVQIISFLELLQLQGHGIVSLFSLKYGTANLLYLIARSFNIHKNNSKIEVCALISSFWADSFHKTSQFFQGCHTFPRENSSMWGWKVVGVKTDSSKWAHPLSLHQLLLLNFLLANPQLNCHIPPVAHQKLALEALTFQLHI